MPASVPQQKSKTYISKIHWPLIYDGATEVNNGTV